MAMNGYEWLWMVMNGYEWLSLINRDEWKRWLWNILMASVEYDGI